MPGFCPFECQRIQALDLGGFTRRFFSVRVSRYGNNSCETKVFVCQQGIVLTGKKSVLNPPPFWFGGGGVEDDRDCEREKGILCVWCGILCDI